MKTHRFLLTASLAATVALAACGPQNEGPVGQPTPGRGGDTPASGVPGENVVPTQANQPGETNPPAVPASAQPTL